MCNPHACAQKPFTPISCDQVAWLNDILDRHADAIMLSTRFASISRLRDVAKEAAIIEIMEILHLDFADTGAAQNAIGSLKIRMKLIRDRVETEEKGDGDES